MLLFPVRIGSVVVLQPAATFFVLYRSTQYGSLSVADSQRGVRWHRQGISRGRASWELDALSCPWIQYGCSVLRRVTSGPPCSRYLFQCRSPARARAGSSPALLVRTQDSQCTAAQPQAHTHKFKAMVEVTRPTLAPRPAASERRPKFRRPAGQPPTLQVISLRLLLVKAYCQWDTPLNGHRGPRDGRPSDPRVLKLEVNIRSKLNASGSFKLSLECAATSSTIC